MPLMCSGCANMAESNAGNNVHIFFQFCAKSVFVGLATLYCVNDCANFMHVCA